MPFKNHIPKTGTIESILDAAHELGKQWADVFDIRHASHYLTKWAADHKEYDRQRVSMKVGLDRGKIISFKDRYKPGAEDDGGYSIDKKHENTTAYRSGEAANNVYTLAAVRKWQTKGIKLVRRIEIQDEKICALCVVKNGVTYDIDELVHEDLPLTFDTHPYCRGSFIPIIGSITKEKDHQAPDEDHTVTVVSGGNSVEDLPIEYKPFMIPFLNRIGKLPFKVKFTDPSEEFDSKQTNQTLYINPKALHDDDPRAIIAKAKAATMWTKMGDKFKEEYGALIKMGLIHPNRSTSDWRDMFTNTYKEYALNQLDEPYEVLWCKSNFADTRLAKAASINFKCC